MNNDRFYIHSEEGMGLVPSTDVWSENTEGNINQLVDKDNILY